MIYAVLGFLLFRFFIVPNYNRFCASYCGGVDCSESILCRPVDEDGGKFSSEQVSSEAGTIENDNDMEF